MEQTTLQDFVRRKYVRAEGEVLVFKPAKSWIVDGESRVSYTTLIRLLECARELHWQTGVLSVAGDHKVDAVVKKMWVEFFHPLAPGQEARIRSAVQSVGKTSYRLRLFLESRGCGLMATTEMVCVFWDSTTGRPKMPPSEVTSFLRRRMLARR